MLTIKYMKEKIKNDLYKTNLKNLDNNLSDYLKEVKKDAIKRRKEIISLLSQSKKD